MLKLYSYFRSSASFRVRIALHYKELPFEYIPIHLVRDGGKQNSAEFRRVNPMGHVPALDHDGFLISESVAILDYLDHIAPARPLFPSEPKARAQVTQMTELINSGIQPLQNLKVLKELEVELKLGKEQVNAWTQKWISEGFKSLEQILKTTAGQYSYGDQITAADCFLIPQCVPARRFGIKIEDYPLIAKIEANALKLPAFQKALPGAQPDYEP